MGCGCANRAKVRAQIEERIKAAGLGSNKRLNSLVDEIRKKRLEALKRKNG